MITLSFHTILWIIGGYAVLSAAANAMDPRDKTFFGWGYRFLRLLTLSASEVLKEDLHIPLPTAQLPEQEPTTAPDLNK